MKKGGKFMDKYIVALLLSIPFIIILIELEVPWWVPILAGVLIPVGLYLLVILIGIYALLLDYIEKWKENYQNS